MPAKPVTLESVGSIAFLSTLPQRYPSLTFLPSKITLMSSDSFQTWQNEIPVLHSYLSLEAKMPPRHTLSAPPSATQETSIPMRKHCYSLLLALATIEGIHHLLLVLRCINLSCRYWDSEMHSANYSFVEFATDRGYSVFFYDRLGTGKSSM